MEILYTYVILLEKNQQTQDREQALNVKFYVFVKLTNI